MIAAHTYDIIVEYHDGVLSVSKWLVVFLFCILVGLASK